MSFMTYQEIGDEMNITKQAVSQLVKKAVNKTYRTIANGKYVDSPFEAVKAMTLFFNIDNHKDFTQMYKILDDSIIQEIENDEEWKKNQPMC